MVVEQLNMYILVVLSVLVHVDMVLKMLVSGVIAQEAVVVVNGRMVLEGVAGEVCCFGTVMVLEKLKFYCNWMVMVLESLNFCVVYLVLVV